MKKKLLIAITFLISIMMMQVPIDSVIADNTVTGFEGNYPLLPEDEVIVKALNFLEKQQLEDGSIGGFAISAWVTMAISAANKDPHNWGNLVNYLAEKSNLLDPKKATDWERHTLAITACEENPRDFVGINFISKIISFYDGIQIGDQSNLYDDFFGILALISGGIDKDHFIIQNVVDHIKGKQEPNGGWGDVDSTSVAIMALIATGENQDSKIINDALTFIKSAQSENGGFKAWGTANAASTSWAINAINAAGQDPMAIEWEKNGNSPVDFLLSLQQDDGSFDWTNGQSMNPEWMTSYALPALLGKPYPIKICEYNENNPPYTPNKPLGPITGNTGKTYNFYTCSIDTDNDKVQYRFDWDASGSHDYSSWTTLEDSGNTVSLSHIWMVEGTYTVKVQARDEYGETSSWSNGISIEITDEEVVEIDEWEGLIRIEGKNETIWNDVVSVGESYIYAKNVDTGEIEEHYIPYPSVLGAVDEASKKGGFSYVVEYWPSWDAFFIKTIENDSDWWHYWVDYVLPMVDVGKYELTDQDDEILFGYLESWEAHALKIFVDKKVVKKNEEFTVSVFNETDSGVEGATVYVGSETYTTGDDGKVTVSLDTSGSYEIYAEKDGFVRSEKVSIKVKKSVMITKPITNNFYFINSRLYNNFKKTLVIGAIDIEVEVSGDVEKVDFYINDKLVYSDDNSPFKYRLNERSFFKKYRIMVKSYTIETLSYKNLINNFIKILEKIRSYSDKNEIIKSLQILESYFNNFEKTIFKEDDTDTKEVIIINLFPNLYK